VHRHCIHTKQNLLSSSSAATMSDSLFAMVGADYVLMAADTAQSRSVLVMKDYQDKIMKLEDNKLLGASGTPGDKDHFCEYIQKNMALYTLRHNRPMTMHAAAHFIRGELAHALRSSPYMANLLFGGFEEKEGPSLYFVDYLASLQKLDFACQGYAGYFLLSIFDRHYKKGMNLEEGLKLMHLCISQLKTRFVLNAPNFIIKVVDKNGCKILETGQEKQEKPEKQEMSL